MAVKQSSSLAAQAHSAETAPDCNAAAERIAKPHAEIEQVRLPDPKVDYPLDQDCDHAAGNVLMTGFASDQTQRHVFAGHLHAVLATCCISCCVLWFGDCTHTCCLSCLHAESNATSG